MTRRAARWRGAAAWLLAVLAAVLVPLAVAAHWASTTLESGDRYVATMAPLARDRGFTDELASRVTTALYGALPPDVRTSATAAGLRRSVARQVTVALGAPSFQAVWDGANRRAHAEALAVLAGNGAPGASRPGALVVDLTPLVRPLVEQLDRSDIRIFDAVAPGVTSRRLTVTLMTSAQLSESRQVFRILVHLSWVLGAAAAVLLVAALAVATRRWRTAVGFAACTAATAALALAGLAEVRALVVARSAGTEVDPVVASQVFDILVRYLRADLVVTVVAAAAVAVLAAAAGALWRRRGGRGRRGRGRHTGRSATAWSRAAASASSSGT